MSGRKDVVRRVAREPRLRRVVLSFGLHSIGEQAAWIAVTVYAFGRGGVAEAGAVAFLQMAPTVVLAPLAAFAGDRFRADLVLAGGYLVQATAMATTAMLVWTGAGAGYVYASAVVVAVAVSFTGPAIGSLLPRAVTTAADLTAANASVGLLGQAGAFAGPALAGVLLLGGPELVFAVTACGLAAAAALVVGLTFDGPARSTADVDVEFALRDTLAGFRTLGADGDLRLLVLVGALSPLVIGMIDVLVVAVADGPLGGDAAGPGFLASAFGLGGMLGAFASVALVGRTRLVGPLVLAVAVSGVALASLGLFSLAVPVALGFAVCGGGQTIARVAAGSLIPRLAPPARLARVYGVVEGIEGAASALGSVAIASLIAWWGLRPAVVVAGLLVPVSLGLVRRRLGRLDAAAAAPDPALVRLVEATKIFAGLTPLAMERLLASTEELVVEPAVAVVSAGEHGDRYYLVASGALDVTVAGRLVRHLGPGDGFGEIALLRDVPRTATITTTVQSRLHTVGREDFLTAVTGHPGTWRRADAHAQRLLDDDDRRTRGDDVA